ncbi:MAG: FAD dependent oxidoreductase [uncultured Thermomicrobiales bacterium]|uniref:FAD dependent oxidoreductase n=1 Tax=uncultured Thermomicrobiales bacterium TaxID=1645740 RepID=A0A6J4V6M7_9BACT|nr:MAG: FAD dependent oxidoreductase [uncultured Thermomicrobiales bacterium]
MAAPVSPSPDVVVVGAGVIGCSIAYRLAAEGRRVLLLERRGVCSGASGRNGGMTGAGSSMHARSAAGRAVYALTTRNLDLLRGLELELGCDFQLRLPGSLDVITTPEQHAHLAESVAEQRAAGIPVQLLDPRETRTLMPALAPDILGAAYAPGRGHLWPFALVNGFADAARRHGADIRTWTSVDGLLRDDERVVGVVAGGEAIPAGDVVLATNAYAPELLPELPPGAIVPARGQILVTEPVAPFLPLPFGTNFDKEYGRQTTGGQILCGGYRRLDEAEGLGTYEERVTAPVLSGIARCLGRLFPALRGGGVNVVRAWSGIMGFTADGLPLIGRYAPAPGLTLAAGFNGGGFSWGAAVGLVVADLLAGRDPGCDLEPFRPDRFHGAAGPAWANPFTAGEKNNPGRLQAEAAALATPVDEAGPVDD